MGAFTSVHGVLLFAIPLLAGNTFLIGFMFYRCSLRVVTHKKCDQKRVLSFEDLQKTRLPDGSKIISAIATMFTKRSALPCVSEVSGLK